MRLIESAVEVGKAVGHAKEGAPAYCSNFFPAPKKLERWIAHRDLYSDGGEGTALFFRKDRGFWHLHFCAAGPSLLQQALARCATLSTDAIVVDLVGLEPAVAGLAGIFEGAGFRRYSRLFRMARLTPGTGPVAAPPDPRLTVAGPADVQCVHELLLRSFDRRAEQLPQPYEIEAAVDAGQIRIARGNGRLAGLLFFETQGLTSTLRYWLIDPEFRAAGLGSALIRCYFAEQHAVRRFLLWVVADNADAIGKYEHYGYAPDGLVDLVLANEVTRP